MASFFKIYLLKAIITKKVLYLRRLAKRHLDGILVISYLTIAEDMAKGHQCLLRSENKPTFTCSVFV